MLVGVSSSLEPLFQELEGRFENAHGVDVVLVAGASGALSEQVRQGAPLDVFVSAGEEFAQALIDDESALILGDRLTPFAEGRLVLVTSLSEGAVDWRGVLLSPRVSAIAIAHPEVAPYGAAARAAMEAAGVWDDVAGSIVYGANVSQALQFAKDGNADAAFIASAQVAAGLSGELAALPVDANAYPTLTQVVVITASTEVPALAERFRTWLLSPEVQAVLLEYGYASVVPS